MWSAIIGAIIGVIGGVVNYNMSSGDNAKKEAEQKRLLDRAENNSMAIATQNRLDALRQNSISNKINQDASDLNRDQFDFGKRKFASEFVQTKKQWQDTLKRQDEQTAYNKQKDIDTMKRTGMQDFLTQMNNSAKDDLNLKNIILGRSI